MLNRYAKIRKTYEKSKEYLKVIDIFGLIHTLKV